MKRSKTKKQAASKKPRRTTDSIFTTEHCFSYHQVLEIVKKVVSICHPDQIFLISHRSFIGNPDVFIDFLILLPPESPKLRYQQYQELIGAATADIGSVMCAFDSSTNVYQLLLEGHIFYSRICKKEKLLYDNHQVVLPQRTKRLGKEIINNAGAVFNRRYERACDFMAGASYFQKKGNPEMAAFHLSHAGILTLIGFLSALTGTSHFTNNLSGLMRLMLRLTINLYIPFPLHKPEEVRLLQLLDSASVGVRYRDNYRVTTQESDMLFNRVVQLQRIAVKEMNDQLNYLTYWL